MIAFCMICVPGFIQLSNNSSSHLEQSTTRAIPPNRVIGTEMVPNMVPTVTRIEFTHTCHWWTSSEENQRV